MDLEKRIQERFGNLNNNELEIIKTLLVKYIIITAVSHTPENQVSKIEEKVAVTDFTKFDNFEVLFNSIFPLQSEKLEVYINNFMETYGK